MKLRLQSKYLLTAAMGLASAIAANAQIFFSTGAVQAGFLDQKYTYNGTTTGFGGVVGAPLGQAAVAHQAGFPFGTNQWTPNGPNSWWLMPGTTAADGLATTNTPSTFFVFQTSFVFDTTIYNLAASSFGLRTTADNQLQIFDNGVAVGAPGAVDNFVIDSVDNFVLNTGSGLVAGLNTITIYVRNESTLIDNPAGFRLEVTERLVPLIPVPEPSTYGLIGAGALLGLVVIRRIRSKSAIA